MSNKKPLILEGAIARSLGRADKLKIPLMNGSMSVWVPEDTVNTKTKSINKNGTYKPKDDDCYGYSKVTVNVPGNRMVGTGPDGNEYLVEEELDGDGNPTGFHTVEKIPSGIRIVRPPAHRNYEAGQTISFEGLAVVMITKNGGLFTDSAHQNGVLSHDELDFPVTIAVGGSNDYKSTSDLSLAIPQPVTSYYSCTFRDTPYWRGSDGWYYDYTVSPRVSGKSRVIPLWVSGKHFYCIMATAVAGSGQFETYHEMYYLTGDRDNPNVEDRGISGQTSRNASSSYQHDGKTVYYASWGIYLTTDIDKSDTGTVEISESLNSSDQAKIAWTAIYGEEQDTGNEIPVTWDTVSYNLSRTYTDSFKINVTASSG